MGKNVWLDVDGNWTNTANWSLGAAPVTGDDVYILAGSNDIITNISGHSAVLLNSINIGMGFTGTLGSVSGNTHNALEIGLQGAFAVNLGIPRQDGVAGSGSQRLIFDFGTTKYLLNGFNSAQGSLDTGFAPVRIKGSNAGNTANILGGRFGIGTVTGDTATVLTAFAGGGALLYGAGVTAATVNVSGSGAFASYSVPTTLSVTAGATAVVYGANKITTLTVGGLATLFNRDGTSTNTIATTATVLATGVLDLSGNQVAGAIGTTNLYAGGQVKRSAGAPNNIVLNTQLIDCGTLQAAA